MYCPLCTARCVLPIVHYPLWTVSCVLHVVYYTLYPVHCVLYVVYCTLCTARCVVLVVCCTLYTARCVLTVVYCTLCTARCVLSTVAYNWLWCVLHVVYWIRLCTIDCDMYCTLCTEYGCVQLTVMCTARCVLSTAVHNWLWCVLYTWRTIWQHFYSVHTLYSWQRCSPAMPILLTTCRAVHHTVSCKNECILTLVCAETSHVGPNPDSPQTNIAGSECHLHLKPQLTR